MFVTGGWKDAYTDAVFRMVENLPNVRGIVGPWPHEWPDKCSPGKCRLLVVVCWLSTVSSAHNIIYNLHDNAFEPVSIFFLKSSH